jgi:hypothetical protein
MCDGTDAMIVPVEFENVGELLIATGESVNFTLVSESVTLIDEDIVLDADLAPGESWAGFTTGTVDLSAIGAVIYTATINYADDVNAENDVIDGWVVNFEQSIEFVDAVNDTITVEAWPYNIVANAIHNPDSAALVADYLWMGGETTNTLEVNDEGWYYLTITTMDCEYEDSVYIRYFNSIPVLNSGDVSVYPNPNDGIFTLNIAAPFSGDITISLIGITGQVIEERSVNNVQNWIGEFDLENNAAGLYTIRIAMGDQVITKRVVLSR